jgi:hypothetical protein
VPAPHEVHAADDPPPARAAYRPAAQDVHADAPPAASVYAPAPQAVQPAAPPSTAA